MSKLNHEKQNKRTHLNKLTPTFKSLYAGRCSVCDSAIAVGDLIQYGGASANGRRVGVMHVECPISANDELHNRMKARRENLRGAK